MWYSFEPSVTKQQEILLVVENRKYFLPSSTHTWNIARATALSLLPSPLWHRPFSQMTARPQTHSIDGVGKGVSRKPMEIDRNRVNIRVGIIVYARNTRHIHEIPVEGFWGASYLPIEACWFIESLVSVVEQTLHIFFKSPSMSELRERDRETESLDTYCCYPFARHLEYICGAI